MSPKTQTELDEFQKELVRSLHERTIELIEQHATGRSLHHAKTLRVKAKRACAKYIMALHSRRSDSLEKLLDAAEYAGHRFAQVPMSL